MMFLKKIMIKGYILICMSYQKTQSFFLVCHRASVVPALAFKKKMK